VIRILTADLRPCSDCHVEGERRGEIRGNIKKIGGKYNYDRVVTLPLYMPMAGTKYI
jgi:hypothetical protein